MKDVARFTKRRRPSRSRKVLQTKEARFLPSLRNIQEIIRRLSRIRACNARIHVAAFVIRRNHRRWRDPKWSPNYK